MSVKKTCRNCGRERSIIADGCCFVCWKAGKGLADAEKEKALAVAKARIESGGLRSCGKNGRKRKPKTVFLALSKATAAVQAEPTAGGDAISPKESATRNAIPNKRNILCRDGEFRIY